MDSSRENNPSPSPDGGPPSLPSEDRPLQLRLYIAGSTPNSRRAQRHLKDALGRLQARHYRLEIIDVFQEPQRALDDHIIVTPTLIQPTNPSSRMLLGNLSDTEQLYCFLGIEG